MPGFTFGRGSGGPDSGAAASPAGPARLAGPAPRRGRTRWIVPLVTFVVGVVLGAGGIGLVLRGGDEPPPTAAPATASASPTTGESAQVAVPRACLRIADEAKVLQDRIDQAVAAARDLDAAELSDLVRQIDEQQTAIRASSDVCRQGVATATPVPSRAPTVTVTAPAAPERGESAGESAGTSTGTSTGTEAPGKAAAKDSAAAATSRPRASSAATAGDSQR